MTVPTPTFDTPDGEATARVAQMTAMAVTVLEAVARLRAQHAADRANAVDRAAAAARQQRHTEHAAARVAWTPALDDDWLRRATTQDVARAWAAATPWAATDPDAEAAARAAEQRLAALHPEAMHAYHQARADGAAPAEAMAHAAPLFQSRPILEAAAHGPHQTAGPRPPRSPRDIAADAYPYPTTAAVAAASRSRRDIQVITTVPEDRRPAASRR
jgi:hypothetical protein